jgi:hypothetical protein
LGNLTEAHPDEPAYLDRFVGYVEAELDHCLNARQQVYPRGLLNKVRGWSALAAKEPERLRAALTPMIDGTARPLSFFMMEQFPVYDAIHALATFDPGAASAILSRELKHQLEGNMRSGDLFEAVMRLPAPEGDEARDLQLNEANDDQKLQELVNRAVRNDQRPWLMARISADLSSDSPAFVARGMVLAAFLPDNAEAEALWKGRLAEEPTPPWLAKVHRAAQRRYDRLRRAQHWYDAFAAADEAADTFAAHRLFLAEVDARIYCSHTLRPSAEDLAAWPSAKRAHWRWSGEAIKAAVKRDEDELKKTLLFTSPPGHAQHPKLR